MDKDGKLRLELLNAHGKFLSEGVEVNLRHQVLSHNAVLSVNALSLTRLFCAFLMIAVSISSRFDTKRSPDLKK